MSKTKFFNLEYLALNQLEQEHLGRFVLIDLAVGKFRLARILTTWGTLTLDWHSY